LVNWRSIRNATIASSNFRLGNGSYRDPIAEVLLHELRDFSLQFFGRWKWRWWVLLHVRDQEKVAPKINYGNDPSKI
jgi:hypothetical protein